MTSGSPTRRVTSASGSGAPRKGDSHDSGRRANGPKGGAFELPPAAVLGSNPSSHGASREGPASPDARARRLEGGIGSPDARATGHGDEGDHRLSRLEHALDGRAVLDGDRHVGTDVRADDLLRARSNVVRLETWFESLLASLVTTSAREVGSPTTAGSTAASIADGAEVRAYAHPSSRWTLSPRRARGAGRGAAGDLRRSRGARRRALRRGSRAR